MNDMLYVSFDPAEGQARRPLRAYLVIDGTFVKSAQRVASLHLIGSRSCSS